ncbi:MAG: PVC-type heme-binding CxxCH protein [Cyclobacteriaceae bacterium]
MYLKTSNKFLLLIFVIGIFIFTVCTSPYSDSNISSNGGEIQVPDNYRVELVAGPDLVDYPMFATLDQTGRLFVFESTGNVYEDSQEAIENPQYHIKLLEDKDRDGVYDKSTIFADKVGFPQGGVFYKGSLYASSAPDLLKFTDTNGDGVADKREVILSGWTLNINANSLIGPFMGPDGWLYLTSAIRGFDITTKEREQIKGETSRIWRVRPDGSDLEWISAGGMNNPVELTFTEAGEPIGTETYFTNPKAGQRDALVYWIKGGIYPKPNTNIKRDSLVRTGNLMPVVSKYSRVSPSGITRYRNTVLGDEFKDNLFSAQFNTHRVLRHKLFRDSASFRTEDEVFFWSENEDFHPTDVLEDADGSLLILDTGGWFIKGCPLSQVSKPELKGAIYRVRKKNADKLEDPYGNQIQWNSLSPEKAVEYLNDQRPFVSDRAGQLLVDQGTHAILLLSDLLQTSGSVDARTKAVFTLYRIGTDEAREAVRMALDDVDPQVQVAAARSIGLSKDDQAVNKLVKSLRNGEPAVRRQVATALGQIGDNRSVPALLEAAKISENRFINHAIIFALISINSPELLEQGLTHNSPDVQSVAMIALDQIPSYSLQADQIMNFLPSTDKSLQRTVLWLASRHPEWSESMMSFLKTRFRDTSFTGEERDIFVDILVSFCENTGIQRFIAEQMQGASTERKLFLMDVMAKCNIEEFPHMWAEKLGNQLISTDDSQAKARAVELVILRNISSLIPQLNAVVNNSKNAARLRIEALRALTVFQSKLTDQDFNFLYTQLQDENESHVRQQAANVMAQAKLTENQLMQIAKNYLKEIDAIMLPRLLPAFKGAYSKQIGEKLASTLMDSPSLVNFSETYIREVFAEYPEDVKPLVDQIITKLREVRADRLDRIQTMENQIPNGDIEQGRKLFYGKATCSTCHMLGDEGGSFGPDLTSIQQDRSAHDLIEAIVYPEVSLVREYETYRVKTKDQAYTGIIQRQTQDAVVLGISPQSSVRIPRDEIVSTEILDVSMMPRLDHLLTTQEMADLMAYILGQDQNPKTDEAILR